MSEKYKVLKTYKNENPTENEPYIKAFQLIYDTEKNKTLLGLSFANNSGKEIKYISVSLSYSTENGKVKKIVDVNFPENSDKPTYSKTLPIDEKEFADFSVEIENIKYTDDITDDNIQTVAKEKNNDNDKKKLLLRRASVIIAVFAIIVLVASIVIFLLPDKNTDVKGIKNVTGDSSKEYTFEYTTEESNTVTLDATQIGAAGGITDVKVGALTTVTPTDILLSFINGNFYFKGSIYSVSLEKTDNVILALSSSGYYYQQSTNGKELAQSRIDNQSYYINPESKTYLTVTNEIMTTLGKTADDFILKIFNKSMQKNYELYSAVINSKDGLFLRVNYVDGYYDDVYYLDGNIVEINTYDSAGNLTECLIPTEFTSEIPDGLMDITSYTQSDYDTFFADYT